MHHVRDSRLTRKSRSTSLTMGVRTILPLTLEFLLLITFGAGALAQSDTVAEFWPAVDAHVQLADNYRLLGFVGMRKGEESEYQQVNGGLAFGYQWKKITKTHYENIDPDKEHILLLGGGYEFLRTVQSGKPKDEDRAVLEAYPGFRPVPRFLLRDRNRVEFRWVDGVYSTRYRNQLWGEYDIAIRNYRFSPYGAAEFFYNGASASWNEEQYTAGLQFPYKRILMLNTYYLRQNCPTCKPANLNVGGITVNLYFRNGPR